MAVGVEFGCRVKLTCSSSTDMVMLEFSQYSAGSRWRKTAINRKSHEEAGNEADGYYGGLRKLYKADEIVRWKCMWPNRVLE